MIINHNLSAMNAQRQFKINTAATHKNIEKLSSGMRINRAGDDASGLAVSEKMRSQIRGLNQASRNAQDGISLIQTAEGWLNETHAVLQRMRELAVQSANGTYTYEDRLQIETEIKQLVDEVDRISSQAEFNTLKLLRGGFRRGEGAAAQEQTAAAGEANKSAMPSPVPIVKGELNSHGLIRENEGEDKGGVFIHVGANMDHREKIYIEDMSAAALGLSKAPADAQNLRQLSVSYTSQDGANRAIQLLDSAIYRVGKERANLGAFQNRLEGTIRGVDIAAENLQSAESHIRDLDMASEMVDFVKNQILSQSTGSMLAQANMRPQIILRVLG